MLFVNEFEVFTKKSILIYAGPGASKRSLIHTHSTFYSLLNSCYEIKTISSEQLLDDSWETKTALLVIPGGADIPYTQLLNGKGNQKIRTFVERGGAFLGICAGSYYGGAFVDFANGSTLEVMGERELSFFPGIVKGPILSPYDYYSESGARAAEIVWQDASGFRKNETFIVYYNGGGYFVNAAILDQVNVLATYSMGEEFPAIIECQVGDGKAILSGVHFEYDPVLLDKNDKHLQPIIYSLQTKHSQKIQLIKHLLNRLLL